jgi:hypothetical protein
VIGRISITRRTKHQKDRKITPLHHYCTKRRRRENEKTNSRLDDFCICSQVIIPRREAATTGLARTEARSASTNGQNFPISSSPWLPLNPFPRSSLTQPHSGARHWQSTAGAKSQISKTTKMVCDHVCSTASLRICPSCTCFMDTAPKSCNGILTEQALQWRSDGSPIPLMPIRMQCNCGEIQPHFSHLHVEFRRNRPGNLG